MTLRHSTLREDIFSRSKYIDMVERTMKNEMAREHIENDKTIANEINKKVEEELKEYLIESGLSYDDNELTKIREDIKEDIEYDYILEYEDKITDINFKKEYQEQYNFMYNTFKTFISSYNCFKSDSNLGMADKLVNYKNILGKYLFKDFNEETQETDSENGICNYSVRFIQSIVEKYITHLYSKLKEWYETTDDINEKSPILKNVIKEMEKEMTLLEKSRFDNIVKPDYEYVKDNTNKLYISKFNGYLNPNVMEAYKELEKYLSKFYGNIEEDKLGEIYCIFNLVANANNGIINTIKNRELFDFGINERTNPQEIFECYLKTLNIKTKECGGQYRLNALTFVSEITDIINEMVNQKKQPPTMDELINNYDMFRLYTLMKKEDYIQFDYTNEKIINDILTDLKKVYNMIFENMKSADDMVNNCKNALSIMQNIISEYSQFFERVS